jgi:hypothetical protein
MSLVLLMRVKRFQLRGMGRSKLSFLHFGRKGRGANEICRVEMAVKQILCGMSIKIGASVANKECLEWYRDWARTH